MSAEDIESLESELNVLLGQFGSVQESESQYASDLAAYQKSFRRLQKWVNAERQRQQSQKAAQKHQTDRSACTEAAEQKRLLPCNNERIEAMRVQLRRLAHLRPIEPNWLLKLVLGEQLNYYLLAPMQKLAYKRNYELFKIRATLGHFGLTLAGAALHLSDRVEYRTLSRWDGAVALYGAAMYWMILGREGVLRMNGSNIRGWWFAHHVLGVLMCMVLALADKSASRLHGYWGSENAQGHGGLVMRLLSSPLRFKMLFFYAYLSAVQLLQFRYQMSRLYALRALSRVHPMETTNELGQQNVIHHRGLGFLLPWLGGAYVLEFALGWTWLWMGVGRDGEDVHWEATVVGVLMLTMAAGNTLTTLYTFFRKMKPSPSPSQIEIGASKRDE